MSTQPKSELPDVSKPAPQHNWGSALPWVGMREMEMPIRLKLPSGELLGLAARADFGVNLTRSDARGIHMSRLYKTLAEKLPTQEMNFATLKALHTQALDSHADLSTEANLKLKFSLPLLRKALKSDGEGWRSYPVSLEMKGAKEQARLFMEIEVLYSSTCPASAALSRQIIREKAMAHFAAETISRTELESYFANPTSLAATPHAQRSVAKVKLELAPGVSEAPTVLVESLIAKMEEALGTAVQSLVKREDEQEFAVRNAENLMFCEDAARKLDRALESYPGLLGWRGEVSHLESLHPHDAVAEFSAKTLR